MFEYNWDDLTHVFREIIPVRAEHMLHTDQIEYVGYSNLFRPVEVGEKTPEYKVFVERTSGFDGPQVRVKVEEIKE